MRVVQNHKNIGRNPIFTVFTPTYNRAHTLGRVYQSLREQSFRDFEWLVVDDGSTDGTEALVKKWQDEAFFPIRYVWQPNGHKKAAFNRGVQLAKGEFFLPADSDDRFLPFALQRFIDHWESIPAGLRLGFVGVCGLCVTEQGDVVGDEFPGGWGVDSDSMEIQHRFRIRGEKWGFCRTDVLLSHAFPEWLPGHVPEAVVWSDIATNYRTRFVNEVFRVYCSDAGNQLTYTSNPKRDAAGALYWKKCVLDIEILYFWYRPLHFFLESARWVRFRLHLGRKRFGRTFFPRSLAGRCLLCIAFPVGVLWWIVDKYKMSSMNGRK